MRMTCERCIHGWSRLCCFYILASACVAMAVDPEMSNYRNSGRQGLRSITHTRTCWINDGLQKRRSLTHTREWKCMYIISKIYENKKISLRHWPSFLKTVVFETCVDILFSCICILLNRFIKINFNCLRLLVLIFAWLLCLQWAPTLVAALDASCYAWACRHTGEI